MTIEEKLKDLIVSRYGSVKNFSVACDLPYTTVDSILRRGVSKAGISNIFKICDVLKINERELLRQQIVPLLHDEEKAASIEFSEILDSVKHRNILLDGKALSDSEKEIILASIELSLNIIKKTRKNGGEK